VCILSEATYLRTDQGGEGQKQDSTLDEGLFATAQSDKNMEIVK
jgi:hypothetical protein